MFTSFAACSADAAQLPDAAVLAGFEAPAPVAPITGAALSDATDATGSTAAQPPVLVADIWRTRKPLIIVPFTVLLVGALVLLGLMERNRRVRLLWRELLESLQEERQNQQHLVDLSRHFELFLAHSVDFVYLKDAHGRYVFASESVAAAVGCESRKTLEGKRDDDIYPPEAAREYAEQESKLFASGTPQLNLKRSYMRVDGSVGWLSTHNWPVLSPEGGRVLGLFGISRDITAEHAHETQLERAANYDGLTGLPNRGLFYDRLQQAMAAADRRGGEIAVVYLDVDRFKQVNDGHGHAVGDSLLVRFSSVLSSQVRRSDTVARLGGDEFALLLADLNSRNESLQLLDRILVSVAREQSVAGVPLKMSASAGVAFYGSDRHSNPDLLLRHADEAMYAAKQAGRDRYRVYEEPAQSASSALSESLARGIERQEFELHYQPVVDLRNGSLVGVEAALRWRRDSGDVQLADEFLPLLNDEALAVELDRWVLREALRQQREWRDADIDVPVHVNVTASDLSQVEFLSGLESDVREILGSPEASLILEVPESTALADTKTINHVIDVCKGLGVGFAITDFGRSYGTVPQARDIAAGSVKIDRKLVQSMPTSAEDHALLLGVLALARAFDRRVFAEGVDTVEQGEMLLELGCYLAQGFAIASPMPPSELPEWLRDWVPESRWTDCKAPQTLASLARIPRKPGSPMLEVVK